MELNHTIIIPTDDKDLALKLFKSVVYDEYVVVIVILGEGQEKEQYVKWADKRADLKVKGFGRKVIWLRKPDFLEDEIRKLRLESDEAKEKMAPDVDLDSIALFSVSLTTSVMYVKKNDEEITIYNLDRAFIVAGKAKVD